MAERLIPMTKDGQPVEMAVSERDFFHKKLARKDGAPEGSTDAADFETYAAAGYRLGDRYEDRTEYDGPKTQRQYDQEQADRKAAKAEAAKSEPAAAAPVKADDKPAPAEAKKG